MKGYIPELQETLVIHICLVVALSQDSELLVLEEPNYGTRCYQSSNQRNHLNLLNINNINNYSVHMSNSR
jgi:hypothetical protein